MNALEKDQLILTECPRDAMQGLPDFVSTELKVQYINALLKVGFSIIDFGSFVSPKAVPQMQDTAEVLKRLDLSDTNSELLAIVANKRGASDASKYNNINYLGFPLSLSETFQQKNTNKSIAQALDILKEIKDICNKVGMKLQVYFSMGFGNPYGDPYDESVVEEMAAKMQSMEIDAVALSDTTGEATKEQIAHLYKYMSRQFPAMQFGVHLHSIPSTAYQKIEAAYDAGCRKFDGTLKGFGGCPMAKDELTGNIATENIIAMAKDKQETLNINEVALKEAMEISNQIFT